jgi:hypothetical protein
MEVRAEKKAKKNKNQRSQPISVDCGTMLAN